MNYGFSPSPRGSVSPQPVTATSLSPLLSHSKPCFYYKSCTVSRLQQAPSPLKLPDHYVTTKPIVMKKHQFVRRPRQLVPLSPVPGYIARRSRSPTVQGSFSPMRKRLRQVRLVNEGTQLPLDPAPSVLTLASSRDPLHLPHHKSDRVGVRHIE